MLISLRTAACCVIASMVAPSLAGAAVNIERGRLLYENHCTSCHESVVHIRDNRQAKSLGEVYWQTTRWAVERELDWRYEEINDVARYLNTRFYQFEAPVECE
jgi:hypothetical protein